MTIVTDQRGFPASGEAIENPIRLATTSLRLKQQNVWKNVVVHEEEV